MFFRGKEREKQSVWTFRNPVANYTQSLDFILKFYSESNTGLHLRMFTFIELLGLNNYFSYVNIVSA